MERPVGWEREEERAAALMEEGAKLVEMGGGFWDGCWLQIINYIIIILKW